MSAQADTDIKAIDINFSGLNDSDNDEQGINDLYRSSFSMAIQFEGGEKSNKKTLFENLGNLEATINPMIYSLTVKEIKKLQRLSLCSENQTLK